MRVVVTGGTGLIGAEVVRDLAARGDEVVVPTRRPDRYADAGETRVAYVAFPTGAPGWTALVRGADAVVHLAGEPVMHARWTPKRIAELRASRVDSTGAIAAAIAEARTAAPGPAVLVSASAVGIYGMRDDDDVLDEASAHGTDVLAEICEAWENAAKPAEKAGARVAHPRIGIVLSAHGGALAKMLVPFDAFAGGPIGSGRQFWSWVHHADVAAAILFAVDTPALAGAFNLTAPNPATMNDVAASLGRALHRPSALRVPPIALEIALGKERARAVLTGQRVVPRRLAEHGFRFTYDTLDRAIGAVVAERRGR